MAFFGGPREIGTFRSHHSLEDTQRLILLALSPHFSLPDFAVRSPGILDSIYLAEWSSQKIRMAAGNSTRDLWNLIIDFDSAQQLIEGRVHFDRKTIEKWVMVARQITFDIPAVLGEASVQTRRWKPIYA